MPKLALCGGTPVRSRPFPPYATIDHEEKAAAERVLSRGELSGYLGRAGARFRGGEEVRALEGEWCARFGTRNAVSVNSATSGLYAAVGAAGVGPGDEVVVSPYSMSASATAALVYGAKPLFADIDPETFCITAASIERVLTRRTRAIIVVDIFGQPADMAPIMTLAKQHGLVVIEDAAQAAGALYHGKPAGTLADVGVFSLNVHKVIQCGEGGVVVTDDDRLAERLRLVRNHAEAVIADLGSSEHDDLIGFNYRMTELEAAISRAQLKKLDKLVERRVQAADFLRTSLGAIPGLRPATPRPDCRHVYYQLPILYDREAMGGVTRATFVEALRAEGVPVQAGYVAPLYLHPLYARRFPGDPAYRRGACPVVEDMHFERVLTTSLVHPNLSPDDLSEVVAAMQKVAANTAELRAARTST